MKIFENPNYFEISLPAIPELDVLRIQWDFILNFFQIDILYQHHQYYYMQVLNQLNSIVENIWKSKLFWNKSSSNSRIRCASYSVRLHPRFFSNRYPVSASSILLYASAESKKFWNIKDLEVLNLFEKKCSSNPRIRCASYSVRLHPRFFSNRYPVLAWLALLYASAESIKFNSWKYLKIQIISK